MKIDKRFLNTVGASGRLREAMPILVLSVAWVLYFWRALTSNQADQVSLPQGDFSGQFLAFGAYQARRILAGQIPLWNPFNYAGHPFLADTQSAVFYPPRLMTIFVSQFTGGWSYNALQIEVIVHFWAASILMYVFVSSCTGSRTAGIVSALTFAYGGYLTGYPPLQVAVLEAGIWLPAILLGVYKASESGESKPRAWKLRWLAVSGMALGISLLAGHPQTSLFVTYLTIAYIVYRGYIQKNSWMAIFGYVLIVFAIGFGLAAVQLAPAIEYAPLTTRTELSFDTRANGFPFSDLATFLIPNTFTVWSPLYSGVSALVLTTTAVSRRSESSRFWMFAGIAGMGLAFGGITIIYQMAYIGIPGLALFRGQERAAYVVAVSVAVLSGLGVKAIQSTLWRQLTAPRTWAAAILVGWLLAFEALIARVTHPNADLSQLVQGLFFLALLVTLNATLSYCQLRSRTLWHLGLLTLITFDLFSVTISTNWEPFPASGRSLLSSLVAPVQDDKSLYRVDGRVGLGENYGTLIGVQDIGGTSPLRLKALQGYLDLPQYRRHELLAVKYVFTDWTQLEVPSTVRGQTQIGSTVAVLHQIDNPLPRAWMTYDIVKVNSDSEALTMLANSAFDIRTTVLVENSSNQLQGSIEAPLAEVSVTHYEPESMTIQVNTASPGVLVISEMDYPGWHALVDNKPVDIMRADAGIRAIYVPAGSHMVFLYYQPLSFILGAIVSLVVAILLSGLLVGVFPAIPILI